MQKLWIQVSWKIKWAKAKMKKKICAYYYWLFVCVCCREKVWRRRPPPFCLISSASIQSRQISRSFVCVFFFSFLARPLFAATLLPTLFLLFCAFRLFTFPGLCHVSLQKDVLNNHSLELWWLCKLNFLSPFQKTSLKTETSINRQNPMLTIPVAVCMKFQ